MAALTATGGARSCGANAASKLLEEIGRWHPELGARAEELARGYDVNARGSEEASVPDLGADAKRAIVAAQKQREASAVDLIEGLNGELSKARDAA